MTFKKLLPNKCVGFALLLNLVTFSYPQAAPPEGVKQVLSQPAKCSQDSVQKSYDRSSTKSLPTLIKASKIPQPTRKNGEIAGLEVLDVESPGFFRSAGFKKHDLIISVDEAKIRSPADVVSFFSKLIADGSVCVEIKRGESSFNWKLLPSP